MCEIVQNWCYRVLLLREEAAIKENFEVQY